MKSDESRNNESKNHTVSYSLLITALIHVLSFFSVIVLHSMNFLSVEQVLSSFTAKIQSDIIQTKSYLLN